MRAASRLAAVRWRPHATVAHTTQHLEERRGAPREEALLPTVRTAAGLQHYGEARRIQPRQVHTLDPARRSTAHRNPFCCAPALVWRRPPRSQRCGVAPFAGRIVAKY